MVNTKSLKKFLLESNKAGYASGDTTKRINEQDGSTTITFKEKDWKSHDNYFGGEPYGGRTVVFYRNKPVWIMVYYGWVKEGVKVEPVYKVLTDALMQMPKNYPYRGPQEYKEKDYKYTNNWQGKINRFFGEEKIIKKNDIIYKANYIGGFVNKKD